VSFSLTYFCVQRKSLPDLKNDVYTCCVLGASSALSFVLSFVKITIERLFVPQVPFEKFSTVGRGERPVRNEVYEVLLR